MYKTLQDVIDYLKALGVFVFDIEVRRRISEGLLRKHFVLYTSVGNISVIEDEDGSYYMHWW